ncbi:MAG: hypothetical protein J5740_02855 [Bacteroidales bacterium]|nr:hypothetical protein [Bacteroidales bacterium]
MRYSSIAICLLFVLGFSSCVSCSKKDNGPVAPIKKEAVANDDGSYGSGPASAKRWANPEDAPRMGKVTTYKLDGVEELSGLCLSKDKDFMWGVGDQGYLYKIHFDGTYEAGLNIGGDLEGITIDPETGHLYVAYEPKRVCIIKAPNYNKLEKLFDVEDAANYENSGMEGIAFYKGELYLGAQTGANIWRYTLTGEKKYGKVSLRNVCPTISEVGDMCYDAERDRLWVIDSNSNSSRPEYLPFTLYMFSGDASKVIANYALESFTKNNPEVCLVDHTHNCIWIADDSSKSILHKVEFSNL